MKNPHPRCCTRDNRPACQVSPGGDHGAGSTSCDTSRKSRSSAYSNTVSAAGCNSKERLGTAGFGSVTTGDIPGCPHDAGPRPLYTRCSSSSSTGKFADESENIITEMRPSDGGNREERTNIDGLSPRLTNPQHQAEQEGGADQISVVSRTKPAGGVGCSKQEQILSAGATPGPFRETGNSSTSLADHEKESADATAGRASGGKLLTERRTKDYHSNEDAGPGHTTKGAANAPNKPAADDQNAGRRVDDACSIPRPTSADAALVPSRIRSGGVAASPASKAPIPFQFATPELMNTVLAGRGTVGARRQQQQRSQVLTESRPHHQQTEPLVLARQPSFQQRRSASEDQDDRSDCTLS